MLTSSALGISFLYAIWHSTVVRSHLSLDDVDFTVLAATSVLGDLIEKCPPAEACRDAFERMSKATIQMCLSTTGFGSQAGGLDSRRNQSVGTPSNTASPPMDPRLFDDMPSQSYFPPQRRPRPRFDMNLGDLFSEEERESRPLERATHSARVHAQATKQEPETYSSSTSSGLFSASSIPPSAGRLGPPAAGGAAGLVASTSGAPLTAASSTSPMAAAVTPQQQQAQISPYQISNPLPYSNFSQSMQAAYPGMPAFTDLDFLDSFPVGGFGQTGGAADPGLNDLGFGLGGAWDGNHDWADGTGLDLFEGFFFGGAGATGGQ